ncbi:SPG16 protein, partial [Sylvia atricapilla]|nr:SPG16 protein [Sylvia atricapilla]
IVLTGGDDRLWKTWGFPDGNILLTGEGHTDWLSGCCFRPRMSPVTVIHRGFVVRMWRAGEEQCSAPGSARGLKCNCNSRQKSASSASLQNKLRMLMLERCRYTLRGHGGSVNSIEFLPFSSTALTSSADKTLSLWDVRTVSRL